MCRGILDLPRHTRWQFRYLYRSGALVSLFIRPSSPAGFILWRNCAQLPAPVGNLGGYDHETRGELPDFCQRRASAKKDSQANLKTRLGPMGAVERKPNRDKADFAQTSGTLPGGRNCAMVDAAGTSEDLTATQEERRRVSDPYLAFFANKEIVKGRAQWWGPKIKERWGANDAPPVGGINAATPAWAAEERSRASGQESADEERKSRGGLVMGR